MPSGPPERDAGPASADARLRKRSLVLAGHRTSLSIEERFWALLKQLAAEQGISAAALVTRIDRARGEAGGAVNLSSAVRLYVVDRLVERAGLSPRRRSGP